MRYFEELTEQNLQKILENVYKKGLEVENISVIELIEEIKKQFQGHITK